MTSSVGTQTIDVYQDWCDKSDEEADFVCTAILNPEPLQGKLLLEPVNELSKKSSDQWNDDDLMPIVKLLAGRPYIDGTGDNFEGASAFNLIKTAGSWLPQLVNWAKVFNGPKRVEQSQHLFRWLQNTVNGLRLYVFNTNSPGIQY
ncbi:15205_t:CDS:2 [Funneliformis geosporum]|uniref:1245_t:CDS:1 n=1 Tax=Funneliformis geosporum TaxID=1117311 RepID=A0A9W4WS59_9GLOM|nr:15205_t:CDS:2 [Funneliformis geosporum]CAI2182194.1 1245_t:CDS:2 [Funneliformis geosporum]